MSEVLSEKPSFYAVIPADVRYDEDLSSTAKLLYAEITALANSKGYCFATNAYFAQLYKLTTRNVANIISQLAKKSYIEVVNGNSKKRKIFISTMKKISANGEKNFIVNHEENFIQNNTSINNKNNNIYNDNNKINNIYKELSSVVVCYENNISPITQIVRDSMIDWLNDVDSDVIIWAINEAVKLNKRYWKYIEGILRNQFNSGNTTLDKIIASEKERDRKYEFNKRDDSQRDEYDELFKKFELG